jgi:RNA polymerase sigma factor (sigma-70 family)
VGKGLAARITEASYAVEETPKNLELRDAPDYFAPLQNEEQGIEMATNPNTILDYLHRVLKPRGEEALTDGQLLSSFIASQDEASFAALVRRHGPMVWRLCLRVLGHVQDAEDTFQATFLVLARKATAVVKRESVGSFLYGIAYRIALEAKAINDRRKRRERQMEEMPHPEVFPAEAQDWLPWLDHELNLLPEHYRAVIVACDLEGRSRKEAARLLGLSEETISSRLARGRCLLAKRLSRYGLSVSSGALVAEMAHGTASAHVPASLLSSTVETAVLVAMGRAEAVSGSVEVLMKGALKMMFLAKLKLAVGAAVVVTALGVAGLAYQATAEEAKKPSAEDARLSTKREAGRPQADDLKSLRLEIEALRRELRATTERVQRLEARSAPPRDVLDKELSALRKQAESQAAEHETASGYLRRWQERVREGRSLLFQVRRIERDKEDHVKTTRTGTLRINGPGLFGLELTEDGRAETREKVTVGEKAINYFTPARKEIVRVRIKAGGDRDTRIRELIPLVLVGMEHRCDLRLAKEDTYYVYLDILPRTKADESAFRRGRLVLQKESGMPRQLWVEYTGREDLWDLPQSQVGEKADPKEFDALHVPRGWKVMQPAP